MTDQEIIDYYADLLILQYKGKPKAYATIQSIVEPIIMNQLPLDVLSAFDLDTAEGVQLDTIGKYANVSRYGFGFTGPITLNDDDYRVMITVAIIKNTSNSSLYDIQTLLNMFFPSTLLVFDYQNMHMGYLFDSAIGSMDLAEMFVRNGLLPKPMGVELAALIYSNNITSFFGFNTYNVPAYNVHGFNTYTVYDTGCPWLSYTNAV